MDQRYLLSKDLKYKHWGQGNWVDEPDEIRFNHCGFECIIKRSYGLDGPQKDVLFGGHLCGYVVIPKNHYFYDKLIDDIPFECHGGVTHADFNEDKNFMIGFDCAHSFDIVPSMEYMYKKYDGLRKIREEFSHSPFWNSSYKNVNFVIEECKALAEQIAKFEPVA